MSSFFDTYIYQGKYLKSASHQQWALWSRSATTCCRYSGSNLPYPGSHKSCKWRLHRTLRWFDIAARTRCRSCQEKVGSDTPLSLSKMPENSTRTDRPDEIILVGSDVGIQFSPQNQPYAYVHLMYSWMNVECVNKYIIHTVCTFSFPFQSCMA